MRLGFPVRVLGRRGLRAYDSRRAASAPHLSVSLAYLRDIFAYLAAHDIRFYRLSADLAPYATHPDLPQFHRQIDECAALLLAIGAHARRQDLRLTVHAPLQVQLGADDSTLAAQGVESLRVLSELLDAMALGPDAVIVVHVGGLDATHGRADATIGRWIARYESLPDSIRRRLALEHDDSQVSLGAALRIHAATGVPLVFDYLHFRLFNPEAWTLDEALAVALATWPHDRTPKAHFSSPRTELHAVERIDSETSASRWTLRPPRPGHHADLINPWEFAAFVRAAAGARDFDVMIEAKAGDIALLRLRKDLLRYASDVAALESRSADGETRRQEDRETVMHREGMTNDTRSLRFAEFGEFP
jgi:UV DNA damage endonuclease